MDTAPPRCMLRVAAVTTFSLLLLLVSACSGSHPPDEPGSGAAEAHKASGASADQAGQDPLQLRYEATRGTFASLQAQGELAPGAFDSSLFTAEDAQYMMFDSEGCAEGAPCAFDLMSCMMGSEYLPAGSDGEEVDWVELHLANTAFEVLRLEDLLRGQRYPEAVWRPVLVQYEDNTLQLLRTTPPVSENFTSYTGNGEWLLETLLRDLTAYRAQSDPSLLLPVVEGGCGAGEMGINVTTDPPGGFAEFIPVFHYRLCEVRGIDPDDTRACDHWRQPLDGMLFDVAGDYRYQVRWQDGQTDSGKLSFTNFEEGQTVTLRRR